MLSLPPQAVGCHDESCGGELQRLVVLAVSRAFALWLHHLANCLVLVLALLLMLLLVSGPLGFEFGQPQSLPRFHDLECPLESMAHSTNRKRE
jgi:hypothetical protein